MQVTQENPHSQSPDSVLCKQEAGGRAGAEVAEGAVPLSQQLSSSYGRGH